MWLFCFLCYSVGVLSSCVVLCVIECVGEFSRVCLCLFRVLIVIFVGVVLFFL